MKFPKPIRSFVRSLIGAGSAPAIGPSELSKLAAKENVLVLALGAIDSNLPGEQKSLRETHLSKAVEGVPKDRTIVTHCG